MCGRAVACICGVAVREGDTVVGVDACESWLNPGTPFAVKIRQYSQNRETGAAVYRDRTGTKYAVRLSLWLALFA